MSTARGYKTLRTDLPTGVWERLEAEAGAKGVKVATHLRSLIMARDAKKYPGAPRVSGASDTAEPKKKEKS